MKTKLKLNTSIEVNAIQYGIAKTVFAGLIAHRKEGGKYYIKPLIWMGQKKAMARLLNI